MEYDKGVAVKSEIFSASWYVVIGFTSEANIDGDNVAEYELMKFNKDLPTGQVHRGDSSTADVDAFEERAQSDSREVIRNEAELPNKVVAFINNLD